MAKSTKTRSKTLTIKITGKAYREILSAAFENHRTPEQEAAYRVEKTLTGRPAPTSYEAAPTYDAAPEPAQLSPEIPATDSPWTQEQEQQYKAAITQAGMSEAESTAHRILYKTFEAAMEGLRVPVA